MLRKNSLIVFIFIILCSFTVSAATLEGEQKAVDLIYNVLNPLNGNISAVWGEKAKTSDGTEFPCQKYEVTQYGTDFKKFGPPVAFSSSITFSKPEEPFSGIYITVYVIKDSEKMLEFLKTMSASWVPNGETDGFKTIELKTSDTRKDFILICGNYAIREENFNAPSLKDKILLQAQMLGICKSDNELNVGGSGIGVDDPRQPEATFPEDDVEQDSQEVVPDTSDSEPDAGPTEPDSGPDTPPQPAQAEPQVTETTPAEETTTVIDTPKPTPFEKWMNSWNISSTAIRTKYIFENINTSIKPPAGADRMIVLKPKNAKVPAMLEGKFEPENSRSMMYLRFATAQRPDAAAVITVEVNGFPAVSGKRITGDDGWQELEINIGSIHPRFVSIMIKVYPDSYTSSRYNYVFIDQLKVDGKPYINKGFSIVKSALVTETGEEPHLVIRGLWTDLKNRSYIVKQEGNSFTFEASERIKGYIWEVSGKGTITDSKTLQLKFTEKYPLNKSPLSYTASGTYDPSRKVINWTSRSGEFPSIWFFVK